MSENAAGELSHGAIEWPRISIIVPNYNGGKTIEGTLKSILDQGYPALELIVMDGGSKDNSVDIIRKYEKQVAYWESERDRGQSHAINKGFAKCTGEVVNWLCSDDLLEPGALETVGRVLADPAVDWCIGKGRMVFPDWPERDSVMWPTEGEVERVAAGNMIPQPSCFFRRRLLREPAVREGFNYAMDQELWSYFVSKGARWKIIDEVLSTSVQDGANKTRTADYRYYMELDSIFRQYGKLGDRSPTPRWFRSSIRPLAIYLESHPSGLGAYLARHGIQDVGRLQRLWRCLWGRRRRR